MVSQWIRLIQCNYFEITMLMITLDSRITFYTHNNSIPLKADWPECRLYAIQLIPRSCVHLIYWNDNSQFLALTPFCICFVGWSRWQHQLFNFSYTQLAPLNRTLEPLYITGSPQLGSVFQHFYKLHTISFGMWVLQMFQDHIPSFIMQNCSFKLHLFWSLVAAVQRWV